MAPPRLSVPGIVDTLKVNDILSAGSPTGPASLANQYAAMPSLHVAWAVWVALALVAVSPGVRLRGLAWAYPVVTTLVVLGTGNHFLLDAVAGLALVAGSAWLVTRVQPLTVVLPSDRSRVARELAG
jgi:membrane-associated phospholipid phosphatase